MLETIMFTIFMESVHILFDILEFVLKINCNLIPYLQQQMMPFIANEKASRKCNILILNKNSEVESRK